MASGTSSSRRSPVAARWLDRSPTCSESPRTRRGRCSTLLAQRLADEQVLLVLDNCEHLLDDCAVLVDTLVPAEPRPRDHRDEPAATRRPRRGRVAGAVDDGAGPRQRPTRSKTVGACDAVRLFCDRAARGRPGFALSAANAAMIATICAARRRHPARDRARRGTRPHDGARRHRRGSRQSLPSPHRREPHAPPPATDARGLGRLELRPAHRRRATGSSARCRCSPLRSPPRPPRPSAARRRSRHATRSPRSSIGR